MKYGNHQGERSLWKKILNKMLFCILIAGVMAGCKDSATGAEGDGNKENKTFDLVLVSDGTKIGSVTTERITADSDAYIDEGFFATLTVTDSDFPPPFDVGMETGGYCGTWDVQPDEKAEVPCDYDEFLSNPTELTVTAADGNGRDAHPGE